MTLLADACRNTVRRELQSTFSSPQNASAFYSSINDHQRSTCPTMDNCVLCKGFSSCSISKLPPEEQIQVISRLLQEYALSHCGLLSPPISSLLLWKLCFVWSVVDEQMCYIPWQKLSALKDQTVSNHFYLYPECLWDLSNIAPTFFVQLIFNK